MIQEKNFCRSVSIDWKAIIAGALVATSLTFLLNLFAAAIGLTAFTTSHTGIETLALGGLFGTAIGIVASMFAAGWISGYLARDCCEGRHLGALYGFITWSVALLIAIAIAGHLQEYINLYAHFISNSGDTFIQSTSSMNNQGLVRLKLTTGSESLVISTYILFILFFLGAFSASIGGHCGMVYKTQLDE